MALIAYNCPPVDWFVGSSQFTVDSQGTVIEYPDKTLGVEEDWPPSDINIVKNDFRKFVYAAWLAFNDIGWEGDSRSGHWNCWALPDADSGFLHWLIAVKQDNNGQTFLASPVPLPHLDKVAFRKVQVDG